MEAISRGKRRVCIHFVAGERFKKKTMVILNTFHTKALESVESMRADLTDGIGGRKHMYHGRCSGKLKRLMEQDAAFSKGG